MLACAKAGEALVGMEFSHTCVLLLRCLWGVLVHGWVVVGGLLGGPMHGILCMLSIWVLRQMAGCISDVVHSTCKQLYHHIQT